MKLRAFITALATGLAGILFPWRTTANAIVVTPSPLRAPERFDVRIRILSPEAVAARMYVLDAVGELIYSPEADIILSRRIQKFRALIRDDWTNPACHLMIESPLFEPTGETEALEILNDCVRHAMGMRDGSVPPLHPKIIAQSKPFGILK